MSEDTQNDAEVAAEEENKAKAAEETAVAESPAPEASESSDSKDAAASPDGDKKFDKLKKAQAIVGEDSSRSRDDEEDCLRKSFSSTDAPRS